MAIMNLLRTDQLEEFEEFLESEGYMILPLSKNPYEVLRAKKGRVSVIIYRRSEAKEYLSIADKDYKLVKRFLETEKQERASPEKIEVEEKTEDSGLPWE